jgi:hypothetical protein
MLDWSQQDLEIVMQPGAASSLSTISLSFLLFPYYIICNFSICILSISYYIVGQANLIHYMNFDIYVLL